jgi:hypothetical protein
MSLQLAIQIGAAFGSIWLIVQKELSVSPIQSWARTHQIGG